jgi:predicted N-formylglutamate amidohydrolase
VRVPLCRTADGKSRLLLVSIHEGRHVPVELHDANGRPLGISDAADLERHIAFDLGVGEVTSELAEESGAYVFRATHSRLVADLNRYENELECIAPSADGTEIPLNKVLTCEQRDARLAQFHRPVLKCLNAFVEDLARRLGAEPFVVSMHSFARAQKENPAPKAEDICVFGYPEFGISPNLEKFVARLRLENPKLIVGNNRPFSAKSPGLQTSEDDHRMACPVTFPTVVQRNNVFNHFTVEICQDLIKTADDQRSMAGRLCSALAGVRGVQALEIASGGARRGTAKSHAVQARASGRHNTVGGWD